MKGKKPSRFAPARKQFQRLAEVLPGYKPSRFPQCTWPKMSYNNPRTHRLHCLAGARDFNRHVEIIPMQNKGFLQAALAWRNPVQFTSVANQLLRNAHTDSHELAAVFTIRYIGVRPDLQLPINRCVLVDLER